MLGLNTKIPSQTSQVVGAWCNGSGTPGNLVAITMFTSTCRLFLDIHQGSPTLKTEVKKSKGTFSWGPYNQDLSLKVNTRSFIVRIQLEFRFIFARCRSSILNRNHSTGAGRSHGKGFTSHVFDLNAFGGEGQKVWSFGVRVWISALVGNLSNTISPIARKSSDTGCSRRQQLQNHGPKWCSCPHLLHPSKPLASVFRAGALLVSLEQVCLLFFELAWFSFRLCVMSESFKLQIAGMTSGCLEHCAGGIVNL